MMIMTDERLSTMRRVVDGMLRNQCSSDTVPMSYMCTSESQRNRESIQLSHVGVSILFASLVLFVTATGYAVEPEPGADRFKCGTPMVLPDNGSTFPVFRIIANDYGRDGSRAFVGQVCEADGPSQDDSDCYSRPLILVSDGEQICVEKGGEVFLARSPKSGDSTVAVVVGTRIYLYRKGKWNLVAGMEGLTFKPTSVAIAKNGDVFVSTYYQGIFHLRSNELSVIPYPREITLDGHVQLFVTNKGEVFLTQRLLGIYRLIDGKAEKPGLWPIVENSTDGYLIYSWMSTTGDRMWAHTRNNTLYEIDLAKGSISTEKIPGDVEWIKGAVVNERDQVVICNSRGFFQVTDSGVVPMHGLPLVQCHEDIHIDSRNGELVLFDSGGRPQPIRSMYEDKSPAPVPDCPASVCDKLMKPLVLQPPDLAFREQLKGRAYETELVLDYGNRRDFMPVVFRTSFGIDLSYGPNFLFSFLAGYHHPVVELDQNSFKHDKDRKNTLFTIGPQLGYVRVGSGDAPDERFSVGFAMRIWLPVVPWVVSSNHSVEVASKWSGLPRLVNSLNIDCFGLSLDVGHELFETGAENRSGFRASVGLDPVQIIAIILENSIPTIVQ